MQKSNSRSQTLLEAQKPIVEGVVRLFHPHVEGVIHDLGSGTIAAIYNNLSRRSAGEPSAITKFVGSHVDEFPDVFEPYYKGNWDGRKFKCVSITVRDDNGKPVGLVCFNFDTSLFQGISADLISLITVRHTQTLSPIEQFTEDWQQRVNECIANYLEENHTSRKVLTKDQKQAVTSRLYRHGLFNYRKAATYIAGQLHTSRATIYNYLKEKEAQ